MYENVANILKFIKSTSLCYIQTDSDPHKKLIKFSFIFFMSQGLSLSYCQNYFLNLKEGIVNFSRSQFNIYFRMFKKLAKAFQRNKIYLVSVKNSIILVNNSMKKGSANNIIHNISLYNFCERIWFKRLPIFVRIKKKFVKMFLQNYLCFCSN